jgi:antitoxin (DNA-binding transcriptional repressor) of toxin-antitoxin stability system
MCGYAVRCGSSSSFTSHNRPCAEFIPAAARR